MSFQPLSQIHFCRTGLDESNKVWIAPGGDILSTLTSAGRLLASMQEASFQRAEGFNTIRVDSDVIPYYQLMLADTVIYKNEQEAHSFYIVGNIIGVEWINPGCTYVHFKVDYFMTYCHLIDWGKTYAYVIREHVREDWAGSGNPMFSNIGPDEGFNVNADTPCFTWVKDLGPAGTLVVYSPYDNSGRPKFDVKMIGQLPTGLNVLGLSTAAAAQYFDSLAESKEASPFNVADVVAVPSSLISVVTGGGVDQQLESIPCINVGAKQNPSIPEYRNAKCWSSPYFIVRLMSSDGDSLDFNPQWFGNDRSNYQLVLTFTGAGGQSGGARAGFDPQNSVYNGKAWEDFTVAVRSLPKVTWVADGYTQWNTNQGLAAAAGAAAQQSHIINGVLGSVAGNLSSPKSTIAQNAGVVTSAANVIWDTGSNIANYEATVNQAKSTGATAMGGGGSFSAIADIAMGSFGFKVVYYGVQPYAMNCIDQYFDRFGYLQNKLKQLDPMTRPIWSYKKTAECHVAVGVGIPYIAERAINNMFNNGVTLWDGAKFAAGRSIGDYSSPEENRGVAG